LFLSHCHSRRFLFNRKDGFVLGLCCTQISFRCSPYAGSCH
jgi:hypothetical protein